jgi:hypothetical protein
MGVDAVMNDGEAIAQVGREGVPLVAGRRHSGVGGVEGAELHRVLQA